jgi:hypothetical protein
MARDRFESRKVPQPAAEAAVELHVHKLQSLRIRPPYQVVPVEHLVQVRPASNIKCICR